MQKVELIRVEQNENVTIGIFVVDGRCVCWSLEEPWRDNQSDISCIPQGKYSLELEYSPSRKKKLWTIKNVLHRTYVRIHSGNTVHDTEGCPLTGSSPGWLNGKRAVLGSKAAFKKFMNALEGTTVAEINVQDVSI